MLAYLTPLKWAAALLLIAGALFVTAGEALGLPPTLVDAGFYLAMGSAFAYFILRVVERRAGGGQ
jgi:drug/metabolite transporter (DMT)-like permease